MKTFLTHALLVIALLCAFTASASASALDAGALTASVFNPALIDMGLAFAWGGLIVNKSVLQNVFINLKTTFNKAFTETKTTWQKIAMLVPSGSSSNDYKWLGNVPQMRKWVGDKVIKSLAAFGYTVENDDYESTVEVLRKHIEDDNLGIYAPQTQMFGWAAAQLPDEIVYELVNNAFVNKCFDGQFFFDTDHPVGGASVSNKLTVALSNATLAAAEASYGAARTAMKKFKDEEGRPLNITPNVLLVPPALETVGKMLLTNKKLADDTPNPFEGTAELVVDARLTSDTAWFLLDTTKPVKPFIYQERKKPVFVQQTDMNADDVFMRGSYKYGVEARAAGGYGFWQTAFGSTGV